MAETNEDRSMAAPLSDYTIEERAVVHFVAEGVKSAEIHARMLAQYGASTMHRRKDLRLDRTLYGRKNKC
jgi:hypothetical protein